LSERGLVIVDPGRFFSITRQGLEALGEVTPPPRWVRPEAVSASLAKDVVERVYIPDMSAAQRSLHSAKAAAKAKAKANARRGSGLKGVIEPEFEERRMAGRRRKMRGKGRQMSRPRLSRIGQKVSRIGHRQMAVETPSQAQPPCLMRQLPALPQRIKKGRQKGTQS